MAALVCEICGGKLMAKAGGLFECEYCGMQYDKTRIQEMVQEIKGTVKVEGTVQVAGTVTVDEHKSKENLLKRGRIALESGDWMEAKKHFDGVLNYDADCIEAYYGKCCAVCYCDNIHKAIAKKGSKILLHNEFVNLLRVLQPDVVQQMHSEIQKADKQLEANRIEEEAQLLAEEYEQERLEQEAKLQRQNKLRIIVPEMKGLLARSLKHILCVNRDGTVSAYGNNDMGQCNVESWKDVIAVAAGPNCSVGIKADGSVLYAGDSRLAQAVSQWTDVTDVATYDCIRPFVIGLHCDGRVSATPEILNLLQNGRSREELQFYKKKTVCNWRDVAGISCGFQDVFAWKHDGTVAVVGDNEEKSFDVTYWDDIIYISADMTHVVGLHSDGTVTAHGDNKYGQCGVFGWEDVFDIATSVKATFGLRDDGTIIMEGETSRYASAKRWTDIVSIFCNGSTLYGIKSDGTVETTGPIMDMIDVPSGCKLFDDALAFAQERKAKKEKARQIAEEKRIKAIAEKTAALQAEQTNLRTELSNLKGFFSGIRRREIETRLLEIETELKGLK